MKWPNRTAQGFSPGLGARRTRPERATEDGARDLTVFPARADVNLTANCQPLTANRQPLTTMTRRNFFAKTGSAGLATLLARSGHADESRSHPTPDAGTNPPHSTSGLPPGEPGRDYTPVITPNGATLPLKVIDGFKIFHLIAEEVDHEFAPGLRAQCWGFNGQVHGPTIEAVEGDKLRY